MIRFPIKQRRQLFAQILLAVFIPMLIATSLHRHQTDAMEGDSCVECIHHVPHGGHLTSHTISVDDCLLCQFSGLPYLLPTLLGFTCYSFIRKVSCRIVMGTIVARQAPCIMLRAPPSSMIILM
ncbi:MAG: hypothetical protein IKH99_04000 [Prevotella sp.]|nr:hypothetical protein [Prevotella sp.]